MGKISGGINYSTGYNLIYKQIYAVAIALLMVRSVFGLSQLQLGIFSLMTYLSYALLIVKITGTKYNRKEILFLFAGMLLAFLIYQNSGQGLVYTVVLFVLGAKGTDIKFNFKVLYISIFSASLVVVLASFLGVIQRVYNGMLCFGFYNPNGLQSMFSIACLYYIGVNGKKLTFYHLFFFFLFSSVFAIITDSQTGVLINIYIFLMSVFLKRKLVKQISLPIEFIYLAVVGFVMLGVFLYPEFGYDALNAIFTGRLQQANYYLNEYGITLFGNNIIELNAGYEYWHYMLDCGYARLFVNYGLIYGLIYIAAHYFSLKRARKNNDFLTIIVLLGFAIQMISENGGIGFNFNMSMMIFINLLRKEIVKNA